MIGKSVEIPGHKNPKYEVNFFVRNASVVLYMKTSISPLQKAELGSVTN